MSSSKQPPASLRYLKARLRPFGRPVFWASSALLLLVLVVTWEYWLSPQWQIFTGAEPAIPDSQGAIADQLTPEPALSANELAEGATEIDSSSTLLQELENLQEAPVLNLPEPTTQKDQPTGLFAEFIRKQSNTAPQNPATSSLPSRSSQSNAPSSNPFANSAQALLNAGPLADGGLFTDLSAPASSFDTSSASNPTSSVPRNNLPNSSQNTRPVSALQNALNNQAAVNNTATPAQPQQPPALVQEQSPPPQALPGQITYPPANAPRGIYNPPSGASAVPSNAYNFLAPSQPSLNAPIVPVAPVAPTNIGQYSVPPLPQAGVNTPPPVTYGLQPSQLTQPTTAPSRRTQGSYVGGNRLNTFSNP
jgi:hypothetical protein